MAGGLWKTARSKTSSVSISVSLQNLTMKKHSTQTFKVNSVTECGCKLYLVLQSTLLVGEFSLNVPAESKTGFSLYFSQLIIVWIVAYHRKNLYMCIVWQLSYIGYKCHVLPHSHVNFNTFITCSAWTAVKEVASCGRTDSVWAMWAMRSLKTPYA